jgi:hypothetical protein
MTGHELARKLLALPDIDIFVQSRNDKSLWNIKDVEVCSCGCEMYITQEDF